MEGERPPLSVGHLPQIRQVKLGLQIEYLNRRIWGRLGDKLLPLPGRHLPQIRQCKLRIRIHTISCRIWGRTGGGRNDEVVRDLSAVVRSWEDESGDVIPPPACYHIKYELTVRQEVQNERQGEMIRETGNDLIRHQPFHFMRHTG